MKKTFLLLAGFMLMASMAWADELELGVGAAFQDTGNTKAVGGSNSAVDTLYVLRAAYGTLGVLNFSLDSIILPPASVQALTSSYADNGSQILGVFRPGMVNLYDAGIKFALFNKLVMGVQFGVNTLYIYKLDEVKKLMPSLNTDLGANFKVSAGFKFFDALGVEGALYSIQPSVAEGVALAKRFISQDSGTRNLAFNQLLASAIFSGLVVLYL